MTKLEAAYRIHEIASELLAVNHNMRELHAPADITNYIHNLEEIEAGLDDRDVEEVNEEPIDCEARDAGGVRICRQPAVGVISCMRSGYIWIKKPGDGTPEPDSLLSVCQVHWDEIWSFPPRIWPDEEAITQLEAEACDEFFSGNCDQCQAAFDDQNNQLPKP